MNQATGSPSAAFGTKEHCSLVGVVGRFGFGGEAVDGEEFELDGVVTQVLCDGRELGCAAARCFISCTVLTVRADSTASTNSDRTVTRVLPPLGVRRR